MFDTITNESSLVTDSSYVLTTSNFPVYWMTMGDGLYQDLVTEIDNYVIYVLRNQTYSRVYRNVLFNNQTLIALDRSTGETHRLLELDWPHYTYDISSNATHIFLTYNTEPGISSSGYGMVVALNPFNEGYGLIQYSSTDYFSSSELTSTVLDITPFHISTSNINGIFNLIKTPLSSFIAGIVAFVLLRKNKRLNKLS
jgi:hypothetical protein